MLPTFLRVTNYCQHRTLTVDFTAGALTILQAPNGLGKSNLFYALRFALTGEKTPGARKLEDDILDGAASATVEMGFELRNETAGSIVRTIHRKHENSVALKLGDEEISKSNDAIKRFEQIIGYSPRTACEVVIAGQREIEALLFSPVRTRVERFEQFLHGDSFLEPLRSAEEEKLNLFIDEQAPERLSVLEQSRGQVQATAGELERQASMIRETISAPVARELRDKKLRVTRHAQLRQAHGERQSELLATDTAIASARATLDSTATDVADQADALQQQATTESAAWDKWDSYQRDCDQLARLKSEIGPVAAQVSTLEAEALPLAAVQAALQDAKSALAWARASARVADITGQLAKQQAGLDLARTQENQAQTEMRRVRDAHTLCKGTLDVLERAHELLTKSSDRDHVRCPVCESDLRSADGNLLVTRMDAVRTSLAPLHRELQIHTDAIANLRTVTIRAETLIRQHERELAAERTQLTVLADQEQVCALACGVACVASSGHPNETTVEFLENDIRRLTGEESRLQAVAAQLPQVQRLFDTRVATLDVITKRLPSEPPAQPRTDRKTIPDIAARSTAMRRQANQRIHAEATLDSHLGMRSRVAIRLEELQQQATAEGLPTLDVALVLTQGEKDALQEVDEKELALANIERQIATQSGISQQLEVQITATQSAIAYAAETRAYRDHLQQLIDRLKILPRLILRSQLTALCRQMDEILGDFHVAQPFQLDVDANLDFVMRYPNGLTRPLGKASGGERIILGLAFRLAAHRTLAPELPWLAIDEPTNQLAGDNIRVLADLLRHLKSNLGRYNLRHLIVSTHSPLIAAEADTLITLGSQSDSTV